MITPGELWRRLGRLIHRDRAAAELEEEMRLHRELRAAALREHGLDAQSAHDTARRRFGNATVIQQRSTDMWGFQALDQLRSDFRHSVRRLARQRGLTLAVVGVLALGIGATTAMFSAVDAAMLRPLPFHEPERLVVLRNISPPFDPGRGQTFLPAPSPNLVTARTMTDVFSGVAAYAAGGLNLADPDRPVRLNAGVVTTNLFATLGVTPLQGRAFADVDGVPNGPLVAILSYALWQSHYGGRAIDSLNVQLGDKTYQMIGVMRPGFSFPKQSDVWIPMSVPNTFATFDAFRNFLPSVSVARLAPGVTIGVARAQLAAHAERIFGAPDPARPYIAEARKAFHDPAAVRPLQDALVGDRSTALLILLGATALLLLIACANVTNLLLAQAASRRREVAVREVLGATRGRVVRQLLTESVVLALAGAAIGVALAPLALRLIGAIMPTSLVGLADATVDLRVLGFATLLAVVTGVGFGLWPALGSTREAPGETIKSGGGHGATSGRAGHVRRALVGAELALTVMLLVGAGLMLRSFSRVMNEDHGMDTSRVGTLELTLGREPSAVRIAKIEQILDALRNTPGISAAGIVNDLPLSGVGGIGLQVKVPGAPPPAPGARDYARYLMASGDYFAALGIPLLHGRTIAVSDDSLAPRVAVVSKRMAERYWPGTSPVGRAFTLGSGQLTVVGVVDDVREKLGESTDFQMYLSVYAETPRSFALVVRSTLDPRTLLAQMTDAVHRVDRGQAVYNVRMMDEVVGASVATRRTNTVLIAAFASLAVLLAALGVYAVVAYSAAQRRREMGIRTALGATGPQLVQLVASEMVAVAIGGVAVGLAGAWMLARVLSSLLYGVSVHDPVTFAVVPLALLAPAALATLIPARRALRIDPAEVMRAD